MFLRFLCYGEYDIGTSIPSKCTAATDTVTSWHFHVSFVTFVLHSMGRRHWFILPFSTPFFCQGQKFSLFHCNVVPRCPRTLLTSCVCIMTYPLTPQDLIFYCLLSLSKYCLYNNWFRYHFVNTLLSWYYP